MFAFDARTATATSEGYGTHGYGEDSYGDPSTGLTVTTDGASDIGETSAVLTGSLTDLGGTSSVDCRFEYRRTTSFTWSATATQTLSATGNFDASLSGLSDGVYYEFRVVASASDGDTDTGSPSGFTTGEHSVSVSTDGATDVGETAATLNGSLTDLGNANSADVHFEYREAGSSSWNTTSTQPLTATESFTASVTGLASGADYEFRTVAVASDGDSDTGVRSRSRRQPPNTTRLSTRSASPRPVRRTRTRRSAPTGPSPTRTVISAASPYRPTTRPGRR